MWGSGGEGEVEAGEVAGAGVVEGLAVPPGVEADQVEGDGGVDVFEVGLREAPIASAAAAGDRYGLSGSGGALPRRRPLRTVRAGWPRTRLKQAL
ncbi:hypothetical protein ACFU93_45300, partial [Streptomyces sp. NPDC057611]|uniref:hypothetical protein n=1 Tax=Streptomyces sp. NPDC057611 TaxID=3346182 RepID=UPI0036A5504B